MAEDDLELRILGFQNMGEVDGALRIVIVTSRGPIPTLFHPCEGAPGVALCVGGAAGGFGGPAGSLYGRLGSTLPVHGVSVLRLHYRFPDVFAESVLDVLGGLSFVRGLGAREVVLLGHSFGGAVVINAGTLSDTVRGVVAMSSQLHGAHVADRLSPRPLLLVHGTHDTILPHLASEEIFRRAKEPKELRLFDGAGHGLSECIDELFTLVEQWVIDIIGPQKRGNRLE